MLFDLAEFLGEFQLLLLQEAVCQSCQINDDIFQLEHGDLPDIPDVLLPLFVLVLLLFGEIANALVLQRRSDGLALLALGQDLFVVGVAGLVVLADKCRQIRPLDCGQLLGLQILAPVLLRVELGDCFVLSIPHGCELGLVLLLLRFDALPFLLFPLFLLDLSLALELLSLAFGLFAVLALLLLLFGCFGLSLFLEFLFGEFFGRH